MKERAKENRANAKAEDAERAVVEKIAEMPDADRVIAERIHALVKEHAPELGSRTYCGMPAYTSGGKIVCFFQPASKFKARYGTLGFEDTANLDDGAMWPTSFAITEMNEAVEQRFVELLRRALS